MALGIAFNPLYSRFLHTVLLGSIGVNRLVVPLDKVREREYPVTLPTHCFTPGLEVFIIE